MKLRTILTALLVVGIAGLGVSLMLRDQELRTNGSRVIVEPCPTCQDSAATLREMALEVTALRSQVERLDRQLEILRETAPASKPEADPTGELASGEHGGGREERGDARAPDWPAVLQELRQHGALAFLDHEDREATFGAVAMLGFVPDDGRLRQLSHVVRDYRSDLQLAARDGGHDMKAIKLAQTRFEREVARIFDEAKARRLVSVGF